MTSNGNKSQEDTAKTRGKCGLKKDWAATTTVWPGDGKLSFRNKREKRRNEDRDSSDELR